MLYLAFLISLVVEIGDLNQRWFSYGLSRQRWLHHFHLASHAFHIDFHLVLVGFGYGLVGVCVRVASRRVVHNSDNS